jgi:hypothetical protein
MNNIVINTPQNAQVPQIYMETANNLMNYNGTFSFLLDLRSKFIKHLALSDKQWMAAQKCFAKEAKAKAQQSVKFNPISCNIPMIVTANAARYISRSTTINKRFNPRTFLVTKIVSSDKYGFNVKARIDWESSMKDCRCCGRPLTDWRSQATGVGPICVKYTGIPYIKKAADVARFKMQMLDLCKSIGEIDFYIKKSSISQQTILKFEDAINSIINIIVSGSVPTPTPPPAQPKSTPHDAHLDINKFQYDEANKVLYSPDGLIPNHPAGIKLSDCLTIRVSNPQTGGYRVFGGRHVNNTFRTATYICLSDATLKLEIHL